MSPKFAELLFTSKVVFEGEKKKISVEMCLNVVSTNSSVILSQGHKYIICFHTYAWGKVTFKSNQYECYKTMPKTANKHYLLCYIPDECQGFSKSPLSQTPQSRDHGWGVKRSKHPAIGQKRWGWKLGVSLLATLSTFSGNALCWLPKFSVLESFH